MVQIPTSSNSQNLFEAPKPAFELHSRDQGSSLVGRNH